MQTKQEIIEQIQVLKKQRNAVILVHNYQREEVQDIADFVGDSLELSRKAAQTDADVIVFCGVHFMAETAAILSPQKKVLLPDATSGCPMASMLDAAKLRGLKKQYPGAVVVAYVNTTAEVKAESDLCCTSANAETIVRSLKADTVLFVPDQYLGKYVASQTGKHMVFHEGYCPVHMRLLPDYIREMKQLHPEAEVLVHPESKPDATALADKVLSTTGMCLYVQKSACREFIVGTEVGILHRMRKDNPGKLFYPVTELAVCENMKKNSLDKVLASLREMKHEVKVEEHIRLRALNAITKMLEFGRNS